MSVQGAEGVAGVGEVQVRYATAEPVSFRDAFGKKPKAAELGADAPPDETAGSTTADSSMAPGTPARWPTTTPPPTIRTRWSPSPRVVRVMGTKMKKTQGH